MPSSRLHKRRLRKKKRNTKKIIVIVGLLAVVVIVVGYIMLNDNNSRKVLFETSIGNITIQLHDNMPITTTNFKNLVHDGIYDNTIFHRVISGFMVQGGDPTGTGYGDPSIPKIDDEFTDSNENNRGTIAMANGGANTGSSQFFINVVDNNYLDKAHPVFGNVIDGMDVVDTISNVKTDLDPDSQTYNRPLADVTLIKATLID